MTKTALVLGGGGLLGICWETGILAGLQDAGIAPRDADLIVGTSAGSVVGMQLASGRPLDDMMAEHFAPRTGGVEANMEFDLANLMAIFAKWAAYPEITREACAEIGRMAIASKTMREEAWIDSFVPTMPAEWPEQPVLITAVDAESGEFMLWERVSGIDPHLAVATSCAVPGLFPAVTVNGRRYVDGGVRSGTNGDLAEGYDSVLIVAPIGARPDGIDPLLGRIARAEAEALRAAGSHVELVFPDAGTLEAIGINRMDNTRRGITAEAGLRQGRELAARLDGRWAVAA